ncbi:hypothetical protein [Dongia sp. agr-C8]
MDSAATRTRVCRQPLAKGLDELPGGSLEIAGAPGVGSTVVVTRPMQR